MPYYQPVKCHCGRKAFYNHNIGAWKCGWCRCLLHGNGSISYRDKRCDIGTETDWTGNDDNNTMIRKGLDEPQF